MVCFRLDSPQTAVICFGPTVKERLRQRIMSAAVIRLCFHLQYKAKMCLHEGTHYFYPLPPRICICLYQFNVEAWEGGLCATWSTWLTRGSVFGVYYMLHEAVCCIFLFCKATECSFVLLNIQYLHLMYVSKCLFHQNRVLFCFVLNIGVKWNRQYLHLMYLSK